MFLSKASMNFAGLTVLSALATFANSSIMSSCASAHRQHKPTQARMPVLRAIARIDFNVLFRKVACPEARTAGALAEDHADPAFTFIQLFLQLGFGEIRRDAGLADSHVL